MLMEGGVFTKENTKLTELQPACSEYYYYRACLVIKILSFVFMRLLSKSDHGTTIIILMD